VSRSAIVLFIALAGAVSAASGWQSEVGMQAPAPAAQDPLAGIVPEILPPDIGQILGPPRGRPLEGEELIKKTMAVGEKLRCPVCQGLSIADSPEELAQNMRAQVRDLLAQGYSRDQILAYFEGSYGEFVLLEPKLEGINWLVWLAPVAALLLGAVVVVRSLKRMSAGAPAPAPATAPKAAPPEVDPELAPYLLEARRLAYGESPPGETDDA
jgi:cytochrome c-type biogenesis protein CcmH